MIVLLIDAKETKKFTLKELQQHYPYSHWTEKKVLYYAENNLTFHNYAVDYINED